MDVVKLIEAAEFCKDNPTRCEGCPSIDDCPFCIGDNAIIVLSMRDHYEALVSSERSKVIAEVKEWASRYMDAMDDINEPWDAGASIALGRLRDKLDLMDKE